MQTLRLQSSDGVIFHVDLETACCSGVIKTMFDNNAVNKNSDEVVPVPKVKAQTLAKVLEWCAYHRYDDPVPDDEETTGAKRTDDIAPWDVEFLKLDADVLLELIMAANYMEV